MLLLMKGITFITLWNIIHVLIIMILGWVTIWDQTSIGVFGQITEIDESVFGNRSCD